MVPINHINTLHFPATLKRAIFLCSIVTYTLTPSLTCKPQRQRQDIVDPDRRVAKTKRVLKEQVAKEFQEDAAKNAQAIDEDTWGEKPTVITTTLHYIVLTTLGAFVMTPLCMQFGADDAHKISVVMNPLRWGIWKIIGMTCGILISGIAAFLLAYLYIHAYTHTLKLKYPLLYHSIIHFCLCLEGALATFLFFYFIDPKSIGGLDLGKYIAFLPIQFSLESCLAAAYFYLRTLEKQLQAEKKAIKRKKRRAKKSEDRGEEQD